MLAVMEGVRGGSEDLCLGMESVLVGEVTNLRDVKKAALCILSPCCVHL